MNQEPTPSKSVGSKRSSPFGYNPLVVETPAKRPRISLPVENVDDDDLERVMKESLKSAEVEKARPTGAEEEDQALKAAIAASLKEAQEPSTSPAKLNSASQEEEDLKAALAASLAEEQPPALPDDIAKKEEEDLMRALQESQATAHQDLDFLDAMEDIEEPIQTVEDREAESLVLDMNTAEDDIEDVEVIPDSLEVSSSVIMEDIDQPTLNTSSDAAPTESSNPGTHTLVKKEEELIKDKAPQVQLPPAADPNVLQASYSLTSVVSHSGRLANTGHYICTAASRKDAEDPVWKDYDDAMVKTTTESLVTTSRNRQQAAYILIYTHDSS